MLTNVFAYKGIIGIACNPQASGLINDPTQPGQLGVLIDLQYMRFTTEAVNLLKTINKGRDSIGDIMCWQAGDKKCFGWMGGWLMLFKPEQAVADRDYAPELITSELIDDSIVIPQGFIDAVDEGEGESNDEE